MPTQEVLTQLFNALALGFALVAAMDFGTRLLVAYKQVSTVSSSPLTEIGQLTSQSPPVMTLQKLPQLSDPWLLPLEGAREPSPVSLVETERRHLWLLPQAKETSIAVAPKKEELLLGVDIDKLKLRQARRIAKLLEIAQKVNGRDQKLEALKSQIKAKLQQVKSEILQVVKQEVTAS